MCGLEHARANVDVHSSVPYVGSSTGALDHGLVCLIALLGFFKFFAYFHPQTAFFSQ